MEDIHQKLRRQVEFYFSDVNIAKDVFLKSKMAEDAEGFVPLDVLLTFNRLNGITKDKQVLAEALKTSDKLTLHADQSAVRRRDELPESIQIDAQTVYVKPLPPSASLEELSEFFSSFGTVLAVWRRYFQGSKDVSMESRTKPSVFIVFSSTEEAEKLKANPPQWKGTPLSVELKLTYLEQKRQEISAKGKKHTGSAATPAPPKTPAMPKDSSYRLSGCGEIAKFSDIKGLWPVEEQRGVRYVFTPSKEEALVIFQDPSTAEQMVSSLRQRAPTLNGKQPEIAKLEGEEEQTLLDGVEKEIAERAAQNSGRGGRGGRGGGRGGRGGGRGGRGGFKRSRD